MVLRMTVGLVLTVVALAIAGRPDWTLSFDELDREPPSYTVDTLRTLSARFLRDELWLLMGTDALASFGRWKDPEEIVRLARVAACAATALHRPASTRLISASSRAPARTRWDSR